MKTKLLEIINHYGVENQQRNLQEEVFELQEAITCYEYNDMIKNLTKVNFKPIKEHIEEKVADVCVLLMQFCNYYKLNVSNVGQIIDKKIDGQIERTKNETDN